MQKARLISFTLHAPDDDGICAAQQLGDAGALTLNGADVSGGVASFAAAGDYNRVGYQVGVYSAGNLSAVNFTVTGTAADGSALSETVTGPNNSTSETTGYFRTVTGVSASAAVGSDVKVGTVYEAITATYPLDLYTPSYTFSVNIGGTINYTLQEAFERPTAGETASFADNASMSGLDVDAHVTPTDALGAIRAVINSFTGGATFALSITPRRNAC